MTERFAMSASTYSTGTESCCILHDSAPVNGWPDIQSCWCFFGCCLVALFAHLGMMLVRNEVAACTSCGARLDSPQPATERQRSLTPWGACLALPLPGRAARCSLPMLPISSLHCSAAAASAALSSPYTGMLHLSLPCSAWLEHDTRTLLAGVSPGLSS